MTNQNKKVQDEKLEQLSEYEVPTKGPLTDNMGHAISDDENSLKAGERGPSLLEDFLLREKIHHFDHERIPERVVHARGAAAHGYFELTDSLENYTTAKVLTEVGKKTPVFTRFSTVAGFRGSADTPRDVRGFAVRFYTEEGNWDIVGNNIPVFFIQDAIKFPDLIHAVKPEPNNEIPQAASAHDTFWDFISLTPEAMHMVMWQMSDRALPRYFSTMEGFGIHTFRLINKEGKSTFVKYHWKPADGVHSTVWDETQRVIGRDPDFQRRSMWDTLASGGTYEWDLAVQLFTEEDAAQWDFDHLDATKIIPEELVPLRVVGRMVLNRNPENYFAETEQVGYMPTNLVPGMDFSNDPLLQGRLFSYLDTQLIRLGGPNWQQIPINQPINPVANNQRDGFMTSRIPKGRVAYHPAMLDGQEGELTGPREVPASRGGFASYPEHISGEKIRERAESFSDHYGQARLFWNSLTPPEREHLCKGLQFELSMVQDRGVRLRMIDNLEKVHPLLASQVAIALGEQPRAEKTAQPGGKYDSAEETALLAEAEADTTASGGLHKAKGLSMEEGQPKVARHRTVAVLIANGTDEAQVETVQRALKAESAEADLIAPRLGMFGGLKADKTLGNAAMALYDALVIPGGEQAAKALMEAEEVPSFIMNAYRHGKPIAAYSEGVRVWESSDMAELLGDQDAGEYGILTAQQVDGQALVDVVAQHRFWGRPQK